MEELSTICSNHWIDPKVMHSFSLGGLIMNVVPSSKKKWYIHACFCGGKATMLIII